MKIDFTSIFNLEIKAFSSEKISSDVICGNELKLYEKYQ